LYDLVGEKIKEKKEDQKWWNRKRAASKDVQRTMLDKNSSLRIRMAELQTHIDKGELNRFLGCYRTENDREVKRRKMASRGVIANPKQFIGKRVAKEFAVQDPTDSNKMIDAVFFGTVEYISDEAHLWYFVKYDDGDSEEYGLNELQRGIKLYEANKDDDLKAIPNSQGNGFLQMVTLDGLEGEHKIEIDQDTGEPIKGPTTPPRNMATLIDL
jgi:hypothetical protein